MRRSIYYMCVFYAWLRCGCKFNYIYHIGFWRCDNMCTKVMELRICEYIDLCARGLLLRVRVCVCVWVWVCFCVENVCVCVYFVCVFCVYCVCVMWMLLNVAGQVAQGGFESRVTHVRWSVIVPLAQQLRLVVPWHCCAHCWRCQQFQKKSNRSIDCWSGVEKG